MSATPEPVLGGIVVSRPAPLAYGKGPVGLRLLSDLHLGAPQTDYKKIQGEVDAARDAGDRILINGDVFDFILPSDKKRYTPDALHPRLHGRRDIVVECVRWAVEILGPVAGQVDVVGCGNHECFDAGTEILTADGWVPFPELRPEQRVASYRYETGEVEFAVPVGIHGYPFDGELVTVRNQHIDLAVTPNHRVLYRTACHAPASGRRRPGQGGVCRGGRGWRACTNVGGRKYGKVRPSKALALADLAMMSGVRRDYAGDGWRFGEAGGLPGIGFKVPCAGTLNLPGVDAADDEIRAAAWVLTDGWLAKKGTVKVCQRVSKAHLVRDVLAGCGWDYTERTRVRNIKVVCGRTLLKEPEPSVEFALHGAGRLRLKELVPHKDGLPAWLWDCTKSQFDVFLSAYIDGDGHRVKGHEKTSLVVFGRKTFMDGLQALCVSFGYRTTLSEYRSGQYRLNVNPRTDTSVAPSAFGREAYCGRVYCVTTHNDTVVVRRNGKVAITGNSALEKHHSIDPIALLVYELQKLAPDGHAVHHGGYTGFVDYRLRRPGGDSRGTGGVRYVVYYHHGGGGSSPVTKGMIDFSRKDTWINADLIWLGHKHNRFNATTEKLECPLAGDGVTVREVRHVMTGAYFKTYVGQSQKSIRDAGRRTNYAADAGMAPGGRGGARVLLHVVRTRKESTLRVEVVQ